jgi:hypothetical protein
MGAHQVARGREPEADAAGAAGHREVAGRQAEALILHDDGDGVLGPGEADGDPVGGPRLPHGTGEGLVQDAPEGPRVGVEDRGLGVRGDAPVAPGGTARQPDLVQRLAQQVPERKPRGIEPAGAGGLGERVAHLVREGEEAAGDGLHGAVPRHGQAGRKAEEGQRRSFEVTGQEPETAAAGGDEGLAAMQGGLGPAQAAEEVDGCPGRRGEREDEKDVENHPGMVRRSG